MGMDTRTDCIRQQERRNLHRQLCLSTPRTDCIEYAPCAIYFFDLCLSTPRTDCITPPCITISEKMLFASAHPARIASSSTVMKYMRPALPQHTPHGLHQQNRTDAMPQIHAICCELVDSFSDATKAASALTIFPRFSTVKAIYIAIIDSLGRTIDRFFGANRTEKIC